MPFSPLLGGSGFLQMSNIFRSLFWRNRTVDTEGLSSAIATGIAIRVLPLSDCTVEFITMVI